MLHDVFIALASARGNITGINLYPSLILTLAAESMCKCGGHALSGRFRFHKLDFVTVTLELLPQTVLLSGALVLPFASTWHILHSPVLGTCFVCRLLIWREYVYLGHFCPSKRCSLCFLIHTSNVRSIKRYCFVHKYAAIPVQLIIINRREGDHWGDLGVDG